MMMSSTFAYLTVSGHLPHINLHYELQFLNDSVLLAYTAFNYFNKVALFQKLVSFLAAYTFYSSMLTEMLPNK